MKRVQGARLVRYNANSAGNNTGDCVKRALSLAFDMDYNELSKLLREESKRTEFAWNSPLVYRGIARQLGAGKFQFVLKDESQTVENFIDDHCQTGTWLLETSRTPDSAATHICCVIDGTLYDSWESQNYYVDAYSKVDIAERRPFTDIQDHMNDLSSRFKDYILQELNRYIEQYAKKGAEWAQQFSYEVRYFVPDDYQCLCRIGCTIDPVSYCESPKKFYLKFVGVLHPTDTLEQADEILKKTAKTRVYDRLWTVNDLQKKLKETYEEEQKRGGAIKTYTLGNHKLAEAFYRSMPAWARAACRQVYVDRPGQYSDSYDVELQEPDGEIIHFYAPTADDLRKELRMYHDSGSIPGRDYDVYELDIL